MDFPESKLQTKKEVLSLIEDINQAHTLEHGKEIFPDWFYQYVEEQMKSKGLTFEEILNSIKVYLSDLKEIKLYLAFEPSKNLKEKILRLFDGTKSRYLDILVDESIIGGIKIVIDGKIYDESVDSFIDKKLAA